MRMLRVDKFTVTIFILQGHITMQHRCKYLKWIRCLHGIWTLAALLCLMGISPNCMAATSTSSFGISASYALLSEGTWDSASWSSFWKFNDSIHGVGKSSYELCAKMHLTPRQEQLCLQGDGLPEILLEAIRMSAVFCQQQFQYERWNCSLGYHRIQILGNVFRETAVLYAFSAASIEHAISRACAAGHYNKCHCAEASNTIETRQTWKWGGCGDNLAFGRSFTNKFLDNGPKSSINSRNPSQHNNLIVNSRVKEQSDMVLTKLLRRKRTMRTNVAASRKSTISTPKKNQRKKIKDFTRQQVDRHNNAVGMQVVEQLVNRTCKCHGVSGSCTMQTCWNQLAPFSETAKAIKIKYDQAIGVETEIHENSSYLRMTSLANVAAIDKTKKNGKAKQITPNNMKKNRNKKDRYNRKKDVADKSTTITKTAVGGRFSARSQLIYYQTSPDFCNANPFAIGTLDRVCLKGDNCEILCCGRGYNVHISTAVIPCKCKLISCCQVECLNCLVEKQIETCK